MHALKMGSWVILFSFAWNSALADHSPNSIKNVIAAEIEMKALAPAQIKKMTAQAKEDLQKFVLASCESPAAKDLYEQIKVPVLRFKDGSEQIFWPLKSADGSKIDIALTGTPKQSGLFSSTSDEVSAVQRKVSLTQTKKKAYYQNPADGPKTARLEVDSHYDISLREASASASQQIDTCKAQSLLKTVNDKL